MSIIFIYISLCRCRRGRQGEHCVTGTLQWSERIRYNIVCYGLLLFTTAFVFRTHHAASSTRPDTIYILLPCTLTWHYKNMSLQMFYHHLDLNTRCSISTFFAFLGRHFCYTYLPTCQRMLNCTIFSTYWPCTCIHWLFTHIRCSFMLIIF